METQERICSVSPDVKVIATGIILFTKYNKYKQLFEKNIENDNSAVYIIHT